jgi:hypothetical protein
MGYAETILIPRSQHWEYVVLLPENRGTEENTEEAEQGLMDFHVSIFFFKFCPTSSFWNLKVENNSRR